MRYLVKRGNKKFPDRWRTKPPIVRAYSCLLNIAARFDPDFTRDLVPAVEHCRAAEHAGAGRIRREIMYEYVRNWFLPAEFFKFRLLNKSASERQLFMSEHEGVQVFKRSDFNTLPNNKYERYRMFAPYFHREILHGSEQATPEDRQRYLDFVSRHETFIAKTIRGTKGHGIKMLTAREAPDMEMLLDQMGGECIVEALIRQGRALAVFHPQSVNTIRYVTGIDGNGNVITLYALLRVGHGGSIVDNVGSGGAVALIDLETGTVCTDGLCGMDTCEEHPDTHVRFKGTKIPEWEALCSMAYEMHSAHTGQHLFGFDFAWTEDGWDVVEVNPAPSFVSFQALTHRGIRPIVIEKGML